MAQTLEKLFLTKIATMPKEEIDEGTPGKEFFRFFYFEFFKLQGTRRKTLFWDIPKTEYLTLNFGSLRTKTEKFWLPPNTWDFG